MISGGLVVHTAGDLGDEARAKSVVAILRDGVTISNSWDLQVNKKRERKKKKSKGEESNRGEKEPETGHHGASGGHQSSRQRGSGGLGCGRRWALGAPSHLRLGGKDGEIAEGPLSCSGVSPEAL